MHRTNRRQFLSAVATSVAFAASRPSWATSARPLFRIDPETVIANVPEDFMGLSYESSQLAHSDFFSASNVGLIPYFRTLGINGVLRVGGNMSEFTTWSPTDPPSAAADSSSAESPDAGSGSSRTFVISPRSIRNLNTFLEAVNWKLIYGLNLARGTAEAAADEAAFVDKTCGARLIAFQLGNEPDLFHHNGDPHKPWQYGEFMAKWKEFESAVRSRVPNAPIAGPDISYKSAWAADFARDAKGSACLLTSHYYAEGPPTDPRMTLDYLLTEQTRFNEEVQTVIEASRKSGMPFRLAESNSCYHAGKAGVSNTFGSSLWAGDLLARLAASGVAGVNLHGGGNGLYTPIAGSQQEGYSARPIFYGMLVARDLSGSKMLASRLDATGLNVTAYAMKKNAQVVALVFNKGSQSTDIEIHTGSSAAGKATVARLLAPSPEATANVKLAGASVSNDGAWKPLVSESVQVTGGTTTITLPAYSAALVSFERRAETVAGVAGSLRKALWLSVLLAVAFALPGLLTAQQSSYYNGSKEGSLKVEATRWQDAQAKRGDYDWQSYPTRVIEQLKGFQAHAVKLDKYGGRMDISEKATGFYHVAKNGDRWWNIDPAGHAYLNIAVAAVAPGPSPNEKKTLIKLFGDETNWLKTTQMLLQANGFNSMGAWGDVGELRKSPMQATAPMSYTVLINFAYLYATKSRKFPNTTYPGSWMKGAIPVFDPDFPVIVDQIARNVAKYKDDENLYGYFTDNELPFTRSNLDAYLSMPKDDPGYLAAKEWMAQHHASSPNDKLRAEFLGYEAGLYFSITAAALRKYDPNHMVMGSRFTEPEYLLPELFEAAGKSCDVVSVNFYTHWTPPADAMAMWQALAKKPFLITEFYTKAIDSGMTNVTGAGWLVHTQAERGEAYQNVTLALLESGGSVGWQFFRYQDNDPTDTTNKWDDSNIDGNKGIVDAKYRVWQPLLDRQKQINTNAYALADYFDKRKKETH